MIIGGRTLLEIFDPRWSWVMTLLLVISILAVLLVVERLIFYFRRRVQTGKFFKTVSDTYGKGGAEAALEALKGIDTAHAEVAKAGLENIRLPEDILIEVMESEILEQRLRYERYLSGLGTIGYVSPLLGLLGTVIGLIKAFAAIAATGSGGPAVVSQGIAEALLTTALGLMVAVPTIYFFNYFSKRAADIVDELEGLVRKMITLIAHSSAGRHEAAVQTSGS